MASIRKRGNAYELTAYTGYTDGGIQKKRTKTWKIPEGMAEKKAEKEAYKAAVEFEKLLQTGQVAEQGKLKLSNFAKQWFETYAAEQLRPTTATRYRNLYYGRIDQALGSFYLDEITPSKLDSFYRDLKKVNKKPKYVCKDSNLKSAMQKRGWTQKAFSEQYGIAIQTIKVCCQQERVSKETAVIFSEAFGVPLSKMFNEVDTGTLSDKTRLEYHRVLSVLFNSAVKKGYIVSNPCERTDPPKVKKQDAVYLDEEQAVKLLELLQDEPIYYRMPVTVLLFCGMRRGELLGLEWSDVDFTSNTIDINKSLLYLSDRGTFTDDTKNSSSRRVLHVHQSLMDELKEYRKWQLEQSTILCDAWKGSKAVFVTAEGAELRPDTLSNWFRDFINRHPELPEIHLHSLRHSNASLMIAEGIDIVTVAGMLGHANASTTQKIYAHQIKSAQAAAAQTVGNILTGRKKFA